jgi:3-hydroxyanthranilate 3,4-dioxygenase
VVVMSALPRSSVDALQESIRVTPFSSTDLKRWIEENKHLFQPPYKTNRVLAHDKDFIVMILHGPNVRLDFHTEPGEEIFYQIHGDIEVHVKPENERRQVVKIREGEIFLCPGGLAHSPRRGEGTWGLVIERKREKNESEEFTWFCEACDEKVLSQTVHQGDVAAQVTKVYAGFNADPALRTCKKCGYVFPPTPMAERLGFLEPR